MTLCPLHNRLPQTARTKFTSLKNTEHTKETDMKHRNTGQENKTQSTSGTLQYLSHTHTQTTTNKGASCVTENKI